MNTYKDSVDWNKKKGNQRPRGFFIWRNGLLEGPDADRKLQC